MSLLGDNRPLEYYKGMAPDNRTKSGQQDMQSGYTECFHRAKARSSSSGLETRSC